MNFGSDRDGNNNAMEGGDHRGGHRWVRPDVFRAAVGSSSIFWGFLIVAVYVADLKFHVKREDLTSIAQTIGGMAAFSLAALALLHQLASRDRYLRLILAGTTLVLLAAAFLCVWTALLRSDDAAAAVDLRLIYVGALAVISGASAFGVNWLLSRPSKLPSYVVVLHEHIIMALPALVVVPASWPISGEALAISWSLWGLLLLLAATALMLPSMTAGSTD